VSVNDLHWRRMLYVFIRGEQRKTCETRLSADGDGFELVVAEEGVEHIDRFSTIERLLSREHELLQAWRAQGWTQPTGGKR
jgi:hypothetical protein